MEKEQSLLAVRMIASELGYRVGWVRIIDRGVQDILVLKHENGDFHSFAGADKFEVALEWLRREA